MFLSDLLYINVSERGRVDFGERGGEAALQFPLSFPVPLKKHKKLQHKKGAITIIEERRAAALNKMGGSRSCSATKGENKRSVLRDHLQKTLFLEQIKNNQSCNSDVVNFGLQKD